MNTSGSPDWLDDILKTEAPVPDDPVFVAQVLQRLDMPQTVTPARPEAVLLGGAWGEALVLVSAITLLVAFTPAMTQGWLAFSQAPWSAKVWSHGGFVLACLSMAVLVHGAWDEVEGHPSH